MARSLRSTPRDRIVRPTPSWPEQSIRGGDIAPPPPFNRYLVEDPDIVRIKKTHLFYLAALTFGCMTAVFLIGLYAGRDQGVRAALAEYGGEVARIPVSDPATTALAGAVNPTVETVLKPETPVDPVVSPQVAEMDFRPEAKLRAGDSQTPETPPPAPENKINTAAADLTPPSVETPAAKKPEEKKPEEKKLEEKKTEPAASAKPAGSWYIQAGAARSESEALGYVKKFKAAGILARVEKAEIRGNRYFRVIVGPYTDKTAADKDVRKVANSKILKSDPFVRLIK